MFDWYLLSSGGMRDIPPSDAMVCERGGLPYGMSPAALLRMRWQQERRVGFERWVSLLFSRDSKFGNVEVHIPGIVFQFWCSAGVAPSLISEVVG